MSIELRTAQFSDYMAIAALHAYSWQTHYRGSFSDEYLDEHVEEDRLKVWKERLENPSEKQWVLCACEDDELLGFVCVFIDDDAQYGSLLDNLHVMKEQQGRGIGKILMQKAIDYSKEAMPSGKLYLWVLEKNHKAQQFYERMGGQRADDKEFKNPLKGKSIAVRYIWK